MSRLAQAPPSGSLVLLSGDTSGWPSRVPKLAEVGRGRRLVKVVIDPRVCRDFARRGRRRDDASCYIALWVAVVDHCIRASGMRKDPK